MPRVKSAPKIMKAASAYTIFGREYRKNHGQEVEGKSLGEISRVISQAWSSVKDRSRYEKLSVEDKERYEREVAERGPEPVKPKKRRTLAKHLGVASARSAYILFSSDERASVVRKNKNATNPEIVKLIASQWRELSEAKKSKYEKLAAKDKQRYQRELEKAKQENPDEVETHRRENCKRKKKSNFGVKNARTAYIHYCMEVRPEITKNNPGLAMVEVTKIVGQQWGALSEAKKSKYEKLAAKDKQRYQTELLAAKQAAGVTEVTNENVDAPTSETTRKVRRTEKTSNEKTVTKVRKTVRRRKN